MTYEPISMEERANWEEGDVLVDVPDVEEEEDEEVEARTQTLGQPMSRRRDPFDHEVRAATNFEQLQQVWEDATEQLVQEWGVVRQAQIDALVDYVEAAVAAGNVEALASMSAPVLGQEVIYERMREVAQEALDAARAEAIAQGVDIQHVDVIELDEVLLRRSGSIATLMARGISESAARQALLRYGVENLSPEEVAAGVREHLEDLSDQFLQDQLGGALTQAQNTARREVMSRHPAKVYASELLDVNTCANCAPVDGREYASVEDAAEDYPTGGYKDCLGGPRCRGTLVAVYDESDPLA